MSPKIRVVSDGTPRGTRIYEGERELALPVTEVHFSVTGDGPATLTLQLVGVEADVSSDEVHWGLSPMPKPVRDPDRKFFGEKS